MPDATRGFPDSGRPKEDILREIAALKVGDIHGHWSRAFRGPPDVQAVASAAYNLLLSDNGLFALRSDYLRKIEEEVIAMCVDLFHPPAGASGTFTSGGSESIYSALHAMREWARERQPRITSPEVIAPYSAHPTFSKGCHYFGLMLIRTALGSDLRADVDAMRQAVTPQTIGIVASAPCWPYGLYDPVEAIGELAASRELWMHVDACVGGYLAPFAAELGYRFPAWDFRVPAVQSISADLHKFGYCPKPASTILWRSEDLKRFHYVHPDDWPGGAYKMQGFLGSRSAGPIFAAWAVIKYLGRAGYLRLARQVLDTKQDLVDGIRAIEGLEPLTNDLLPVAFGSSTLDMQVIMGEMRKIGWILVATARPPLINVPIDAATDRLVIEAFLSDLRQAAAQARGSSPVTREKLSY
jgi:glutamate/tyrosine decarboxylase-like PLP-dependent enzyme